MGRSAIALQFFRGSPAPIGSSNAGQARQSTASQTILERSRFGQQVSEYHRGPSSPLDRPNSTAYHWFGCRPEKSPWSRPSVHPSLLSELRFRLCSPLVSPPSDYYCTYIP